MDPRVEDLLLHPDFRDEGGSKYERDDRSHVLGALKELGLVTGELSSGVSVSPANGPEKSPTAGAQAGAAQRVQALIDAIEGADEPWHAWHLANTVLHELRGVGALLESDYSALNKAVMRAQPPDHARPSAVCQGEPKLIVAGPPIRRCGWRTLAIEVHEDGVGVVWHFARLGREADGTWPLLPDEADGPHASEWTLVPELGLADDLGTPYVTSRESAVGGGGDEATGLTTFAPAPPPPAGKLSVLVGSLAIEVNL